jgi:hypothetical protein
MNVARRKEGGYAFIFTLQFVLMGPGLRRDDSE